MSKIIEGFKPYGGQHCVTAALKQVFSFYKHDISEEMLFGLGGGLGFVYINLANAPMISGRIKTVEFEEKIAGRLHVKMKYRSSKNYSQIVDQTKQMIDRNEPTIIFADMPYLKYMNLNEDSHFGGHAIVIFGYDDEKKVYYVSDRDNGDYPIRTPKGDIAEDFHLVDYSDMEKARSSKYRPFPANNKYLEVDLSTYSPVTPEAIIEAIKETSNSMLNSPAGLLGVNGINKFSREVLKWSKFETLKLMRAGMTNYFMISADGGTGGGIFRKMYGNFLIEASKIVECNKVEELGKRYIGVSEKWDEIAGLLLALSETGNREILKLISNIAKDIFNEETDILKNMYDVTLQLA